MKKVSINNIKKKKKGFTLVELIIVIAIIAILAAMAIPKFSAVRLDAKVSNDVAAAKNISIVTATLIANGDIIAPQTIDVSTDTKIRGRLDGKVAQSGKSEAISTISFTVKVDKNESITVLAGTNELYPDISGGGRKAHLATASATSATP